jgi:hypothetical protein
MEVSGGISAVTALKSLVFPRAGLLPPPPPPQAGPKAPAAKAAKPLGASNAANAAKNGKTIEEMYQKKSQLEHILLRPDTYIGSTEKQQAQLWVHNGERAGGSCRPCRCWPAHFSVAKSVRSFFCPS